MEIFRSMNRNAQLVSTIKNNREFQLLWNFSMHENNLIKANKNKSNQLHNK